MRPEDLRPWLALLRDLVIIAVGISLLTLGAIYAERALIIGGVVLVVIASGLAIEVQIRRRNNNDRR